MGCSWSSEAKIHTLTFGLTHPAVRIGSAVVHCFWIDLPDGGLLVDAGSPAIGPHLVRRLKADRRRPRWTALTHAHYDHQGGLAAVKSAFPYCRILTHPGDRDRVQRGESVIPRLIGPWTAIQPWVAARIGGPNRLPPCPVDGDISELEAFGVQIVETPGHARPHCSLLLPDGSLLAGDALSTRLTGRPMVNEFGEDRAEMIRSLRRIAELQPTRILSGHGPPCTLDDLRALLADLNQKVG